MSCIKKIVLLGVFTSLIFISAEARESFLTRNKMKAHLDTIYHILDDGYAPAEWKRDYFGWNLEDQLAEAKLQVDKNPHLSVKDFQKIVRRFLASTHDLHVSALFYSTENSDLPFVVKGANERYFIVHVDEARLTPTVYNIQVGDELISFDGKPPHEVVLARQLEFTGTQEEGVYRALAELNLTNRKGSSAEDVPDGPIQIGIKKNGTEKILYYQLTWDYKPEFVINHQIKQNLNDVCSVFENDQIHDFSRKSEEHPLIGAKTSFIPSLGKKWWSCNPTNTFDAYVYEYQKHLIGYVRIPNFRGDEKEELEFKELIAFLEERTDALVIDQVNNPGGRLFHMSAIASMLTNRPLYLPKHRISIDQSHVKEAASLIPVLDQVSNDEEARITIGSTSFGNPVTYQTAKFLLGYCRFILSEWNAGKTLTALFYLYGLDQINPNPDVTYSKPILILVNELSFSCGDFFPAIFQDNKRATILGTKTGGAGGYVCYATFPNLFGLKRLCYTGSIAERIDKNPIENLGVTPDIFYSISEFDLQHSYSNYIKKINEVILNLCEESK